MGIQDMSVPSSPLGYEPKTSLKNWNLFLKFFKVYFIDHAIIVVLFFLSPL